MRVRIGIVDDHPAAVLGLTAILNAQAGMHVFAAAATATELVRDTHELELIILDAVLADGSTPTENVRHLAPLGAVVLTWAAEHHLSYAREAMLAGAVGVLKKTDSPGALVRKILSALRGDPMPLVDEVELDETDLPEVSLTRRETQVLTSYASGRTADEVAAQMRISRDTVLDHIRRIRGKYAAAGRAAPTKVDLFRRAHEDGLIL